MGRSLKRQKAILPDKGIQAYTVTNKALLSEPAMLKKASSLEVQNETKNTIV
jgi:hypothetical protein